MRAMANTQARPGDGIANGDVMLEVRNLKMHFPVNSGVLFQRAVAQIKAVDDVSFAVRRGETLGIVGESAPGKRPSGAAFCNCTGPRQGR